jgi:hypothetical protein
MRLWNEKEIEMKFRMIPFLLLLLTGCATTDRAPSSADKHEAGSNTTMIALQPRNTGEIRKYVLQLPNVAEVRLDGKKYVGEWSDSRCSTPECLGEFMSVPKHNRMHVRKGSAEFVAEDNTRLSCEWVSLLKKVIGTCQTQDGRQFNLKAG